MNEAQHTPGPWSVSHEDFRTNDGQRAVMAPDPEHGRRRVALIDPMAGHFTRGGRFVGDPACTEMTANANLIAAAPDLLAALHLYLEALPALRGKDIGAPDSLARKLQALHIAAEDAARAAIAKAESRVPA